MSTAIDVMARVVTAPQRGVMRSGVQRRWQIRAEQQLAEHEPCFATDRRFFCEETGCPWRAECLALRAEWRR